MSRPQTVKGRALLATYLQTTREQVLKDILAIEVEAHVGMVEESTGGEE